MTGPAVLARGAVVAAPGAWRPLPDGWGWGDAAAACVDLGARDAYVVRSPGEREPEIPTSAAAGVEWRFEVEGVRFVVPHLDAGAGPFAGVAPGELVQVFAQLRRLLGVDWADGVGHTAERLIRSTHPPAKGGTQPDRSAAAVPEPAEQRNLEMPYAWSRPLTVAERQAPYVHAFDRNAMYLSAWQTVELGMGLPVHHHRPHFDHRRAGLWRLSGVAAGVDDLMPPCWTPEREWFTTPTVARMLEVCAGMEAPTVVEAWLWPAKSRYLRGAAERLRDARAAAMIQRAAMAGHLSAGDDTALSAYVVADVVLESVKALYQRQTGRFLAGGRDPATGMARPDWAHFVIAQARVNLHRGIERLGARPFAIGVDGLLFATDEPDAAAFAQRIRLPIGDGLRDFTIEGTGPSGPVFDAAAAGGPSIWPMFQALSESVVVV